MLAPCLSSPRIQEKPSSPEAVPIVNIALRSVKNINLISINLVIHISSSEGNDKTLGYLGLRASENGQVGGVGW